MALQEGIYTASVDYDPGTYLPGYEKEFMGMVLPLGTYCEERNDNYESIYGFITGGTVTISKVATGYRLVLDFTTNKGHKISGTYEGKVRIHRQAFDRITQAHYRNSQSVETSPSLML